MQFKEKKVKVCTSHRIYGDQKAIIKSFTPICDKERVGFQYNTNEIYIDLSDLDAWEYKDTGIKIHSKLMEISIELI